MAVGLGAALVAGCKSEPHPYEQRFWTTDLKFTVSNDPSPPRARDRTVYRVTVRDKQTGQPIEGGQGMIFASTREGAKTWDPLLPGPELGTYYGTLKYVTAGEWAVAIQFRRDSTKQLQRVADWMQEVRNATEDKGT